MIFDFDNTFFVHLGLLVVLFVLLGRYFTGPWLALKERRESMSIIRIQRAEKLFETAHTLHARCDTIINEVKSESVNQRNQVRLKATMVADDRRIQADQDAAILFEKSEKEILEHAQTVRRDMPTTVQPLSHALAKRMLGREL